MNYEDFAHSPSGDLVPTVFEAKAFVPHPLPPKLDLGSITLEFGQASAALGELRGACRRLRNPYILIRPLQRLEAQTSSAMEGTYTTSDELALAEAGIEKDLQTEAIEVANYTRALSWAEEKLKELPISGRLLKGAHEILLQRVGRQRGQDKRPGQYKNTQNMIGGFRIETARFIPAPPVQTERAMADLETYINREDRKPGEALIDLALVHYQFETIHPFTDGNGRVGRMLISLMAMSEGLLDMPVLYVSPELESRKSEYIDLMYSVSAAGSWEEWIRFFLNIVTLSAARATRTVDDILALHQRYQETVAAVSRSSNLHQLIDILFDRPVVQARTVVERLSITDAAARNLLKQLAQLGILVESQNYYPTAWIANELIDISRPSE